MKTIKILILALFAITLQTFGQAGYQAFTTDTIKGDTVTYTSGVKVAYNGFVTFDYTMAGYTAGDTVYVDFIESNNDFTTTNILSTTTFIQGTTTANQHLVDNPAEYLKYRFTFRGKAVADSAIVTNPLFIYKR